MSPGLLACASATSFGGVGRLRKVASSFSVGCVATNRPAASVVHGYPRRVAAAAPRRRFTKGLDRGVTLAVLPRMSNDVTNGSIRRVREIMLAEITAGIADDHDLKRRLDYAIEKERQKIGDIVNARLRTAAGAFRHACRDALQLLKQHLRREDAFASRTFTASFGYASKIETRSGIDWAGLVMAIGGSALLTGVTGGWFLALGLITNGLSVLNSIKFYFSGNYRKDQQKRAVNRALDEARAKIADDVIHALDSARAALEEEADRLLARLCVIMEQHLEAWHRAHVAAAELHALAEDRRRNCYSGPDVPFPMFVGLHPDPVPRVRLQLADGLLHEAMHLLLSLVEDVMPLVIGSSELRHSPWERCPQPLKAFYTASSSSPLSGRSCRRRC